MSENPSCHPESSKTPTTLEEAERVNALERAGTGFAGKTMQAGFTTGSTQGGYRALYLHIPFCKTRCAYCNFHTRAVLPSDARIETYVAQLSAEIRSAAKRGDFVDLRTIYMGGGTPTFLGLSRLVELAYLASLCIKLEQIQEYTLEANPESLKPAMIRDLYALGIDRLSLGVQSFVDAELASLGRIHDAEQATRAVKEARERFRNISLDLICGIPGQTMPSWQYSLEQALGLEPEHLSIYPLQIEEGTRLAKEIAEGRLTAPDEDEQAEFMEQAETILRSSGYLHYEVASYAKPGFESKHNIGYWTGTPYLGLGEGAASMRNLPDKTRERCVNGEVSEYLTEKEALAEDLFLAMRMDRGVCEEQLLVASRLLPKALDTFEELQDRGLVTHRAGRYQPTKKGWLLGNELYARIWALSG